MLDLAFSASTGSLETPLGRIYAEAKLLGASRPRLTSSSATRFPRPKGMELANPANWPLCTSYTSFMDKVVKAIRGAQITLLRTDAVAAVSAFAALPRGHAGTRAQQTASVPRVGARLRKTRPVSVKKN